MAECGGDNREKGEDEPARLEQSERERIDDELERRNQDMINLEAESTYDVFLSSGIDSCAFADSLYHCLKADGIRVFRDGELPLSVYSSKIYIPIFSVNYPFSTRCLDALELMVEHTSRSGGKKEILPVLYDVEWSDVNMEKKSLYGDALDSHRLWFGAEKVEKWEKALAEAGKVKGWDRCSYKGERDLITTIVGEISPKLKIEHNYAPEDLSTSAEALKIDIEHEDLFTGAGPLKANIEHKYAPEDLFTGAEALKTDIEHEDLFTGAGPLKANIEHKYAPEDLFTDAESLKTDIEHEDLFTGAGPLKANIEHKYAPEDLFTDAESLKTDIESLKTDIEHEVLFTGAGPLKANIEHKYAPEDLFTGAEPLKTDIVHEGLFTGAGPLKANIEHSYATEDLSTSAGPLKTDIEHEDLFTGAVPLKANIEHNYEPKDLYTGADPLEAIANLINVHTSHLKMAQADAGFQGPMLSHRTSELQDSQESKIMELLELEVNDVRIVGIHGRDGIGKTALAKIVYDRISLRFDTCSFLAEIEETAKQPGGVQYLQTKLIFDILKREFEVAFAFKEVRFLKEIFRNMKILIVLDDVERGYLLEEFVGPELDWFGSGSRIIVTSKERSGLQGFVDRGLARTYDVIPMHHDLAFDFFWHCAIGKRDKLHFYVDIANKIVKAAKGLPLLLKVFGSFLHDRGLDDWIEFEYLIQKFQEDYQKILRIIYDASDRKRKQMYLDIACFPPEVDCRIASYMWHPYDRPEIEVLHHMSLIQIEENKIGMHGMLRCLAREIIRKGFRDPGTGVVLYIPAIAQDTNKGRKGTDHLNTEEAGFEILPNTTFLNLGHPNIGGKYADTLLNVRWLHWQGCPRDAISIHLEKNENLVILDLSWSKVTESWGGWKRIKMKCLKVLNLTGCGDLLVSPSFSCCPNVEILILERCSRLVHLDPSINDLKLLVTLNLKFCTELSILPVEMGEMNALEELLIEGTSVRELPVSIGKLVQLQILSAANCFSLVHVPGSVYKLKALSVLALDNAKILELHESIGHLRKLRSLSLRNCRGLGKLPESIGKMRFLVELDISSTGISRLPNSIKNLWRLKVLKMDSCFVREFPRDIGWLTDLEEVHASWCRSLGGVIPSNIWELHRLRELRLRGTRISSLPSEIYWLSSLKTLDLLHCVNIKELPRLPSSLIHLYVNPSLTRYV